MTAHVYIYGDILNQLQLADGQGASLSSVMAQLATQFPYTDVEVHIHSRGGAVTEGFAIYNYLRSLKKPVTTVIEGLCASIATVVALAGDVRKTNPYAELFLHNPWGEATGNAAYMERYTAELKRAEARLLDLYVNRTGLPRTKLQVLMGNETTLSATQALQMGFVTTIATEPVAYASLSLQSKNQPNNNLISMTKSAKLARVILNFLGGKQPNIYNSLTTTLDDGTEVFVDGSGDAPAVGDILYMGKDNTAPVAKAGTYVLADGTVVETDETGVIANVTLPESEEELPEVAAIKALKKQNSALKRKIKNLEDAEVLVLQQLEQIKAQVQSNYQPKPRQKEVFARNVAPNPAERNRVLEAKEKANNQ